MALDLNPQPAGRVLLLLSETFEETEAQEVGASPRRTRLDGDRAAIPTQHSDPRACTPGFAPKPALRRDALTYGHAARTCPTLSDRGS